MEIETKIEWFVEIRRRTELPVTPNIWDCWRKYSSEEKAQLEVAKMRDSRNEWRIVKRTNSTELIEFNELAKEEV